ncbi:MAG: TraI domain-containing protein [Burkholderiales bacterium]|nr:TraI domain-containing protein [Burkholderiales bacterium]
MTFNDTQSSDVTTRAIDALVSRESPALSAQEILERSGVANLVVLVRVRMGFPPETFALAAQPLIERYAEYVQLQSVSGSLRYGGPGGRLHRALAIVLRALDHRRGQILPRNAPPETLGALAHRWTYAVFAAALLRDVGSEPSADAARRFEGWVPGLIQRWLGEDVALLAELRAVLTGAADPSSAIAELVERAATGVRPAIAVSVPSDVPEPLSSAAEATAEPTLATPAAHGPEFLDGVDDTGSERARRFMAWVKQGVADGTLPVNARGALVHRVEDGLLLASPGIFRAFVRQEGIGRDEPRDVAKRLQREVLRAGWHLRSDGGVNLHGYAWRHDGGQDVRIHGVVILAPARFVDPLPPVNPALVRVADSTAAGE